MLVPELPHLSSYLGFMMYREKGLGTHGNSGAGWDLKGPPPNSDRRLSSQIKDLEMTKASPGGSAAHQMGPDDACLESNGAAMEIGVPSSGRAPPEYV